MKRPLLRLMCLMLLTPLLAGCKYDHSFMQMDSNSGFPFFGLQLAVDSGSRPPTRTPGARDPEHQFRIGEDLEVPTWIPRRRRAIPRKRTTLVSRRETVAVSSGLTAHAADLNERIRYSLPLLSTDRSFSAHNVDLRRAAF